MDLIVGVTMVLILMVFILVFCKNITVNLNINYPEPKYYELGDEFDERGEPKANQEEYDYNKVIEEFNKIMLDTEDDNNG